MRLLRRNLLVTFRLFVMCLCGCLIVVLFLNLFPLVEVNTCHRIGSGGAVNSLSNVIASPVLNEKDNFLCLIIPFRDRFEELNEFVPMISEFLNKKSIAHAIFVINQIDTLRFNRFENFLLKLRPCQIFLFSYFTTYLSINKKKDILNI
jgi:hypothetical protein